MSAEEFNEDDVRAVMDRFIHEVDGEPRLEVDVDGRRHTVGIRPIFSFERDLLDDLIAPRAGTDVQGGAIPVKGHWIYGWLNHKGEDYINNIWKNYQYFLKYIEARTFKMGNVSTYNRSPGTYDSMYRYLLLLEELGLLTRHRRESVPQDEYDFPVPEEFRSRTFIKLEDGVDGTEEDWSNPYEALYPEGQKPEEEVEEEPPTEDEQGPELQPIEIEGDGEEDDTEDEVEEGGVQERLERLTDAPTAIGGTADLPDEGASFSQFPEKEDLVDFIEASFPEALRRTFEDAPIPVTQVEPEDFSLGQVAVIGNWALGDAVPGETTLRLVVSIDGSLAQVNPGFIPGGMEIHLEDVMEEDNIYPDIFPKYFVLSTYNSAFQRKVDEAVRREQSELVYYDLQDMELKEL